MSAMPVHFKYLGAGFRVYLKVFSQHIINVRRLCKRNKNQVTNKKRVWVKDYISRVFSFVAKVHKGHYNVSCLY